MGSGAWQCNDQAITERVPMYHVPTQSNRIRQASNSFVGLYNYIRLIKLEGSEPTWFQ